MKENRRDVPSDTRDSERGRTRAPEGIVALGYHGNPVLIGRRIVHCFALAQMTQLSIKVQEEQSEYLSTLKSEGLLRTEMRFAKGHHFLQQYRHHRIHSFTNTKHTTTLVAAAAAAVKGGGVGVGRRGQSGEVGSGKKMLRVLEVASSASAQRLPSCVGERPFF
ncbi:hypothetical protein EYF80_043079 [Liparis tanakae]|uniref:Uncharacterized protein n=1 Tax=Liparis tanakae TaxID=230148 RepID=A0A4Z2G0N0_9TELE|nr:hypothetical protein EYF80_043079 [Liparis tanakae]